MRKSGIRSQSAGFTLVELMIVVVIVGVLATLAGYGVRKYIIHTKTAEARNSLGQMSKDALTAFVRENMSGTVLALGVSSTKSNFVCAGAAKTIPQDKAAVQGKKYQSEPWEWQEGAPTQGWQCLKFSMSDPQYFLYDYASIGGDAEGTTFDMIAHGDLDGDGTLSTYALSGRLQKDTQSGEVIPTIAPNLIELQEGE